MSRDAGSIPQSVIVDLGNFSLVIFVQVAVRQNIVREMKFIHRLKARVCPSVIGDENAD